MNEKEKELWDAYRKEGYDLRWKKRDQWRIRNGLDDGKRLDLFERCSSKDWHMESVKDVLLLLSYGWEFDVTFRGDDYFITPNWWYTIWGPGNVPLYESLDLDDFGENARIGENGEFYLKDVVDELEF